MIISEFNPKRASVRAGKGGFGLVKGIEEPADFLALKPLPGFYRAPAGGDFRKPLHQAGFPPLRAFIWRFKQVPDDKFHGNLGKSGREGMDGEAPTAERLDLETESGEVFADFFQVGGLFWHEVQDARHG